MKNFKLSICLGIVLLALTLTMNVSAAGKQVMIKLAFMGDGANRESTQKIFDQFTQENPDIKVDLLYIPTAGGNAWNDYFMKIQTLIAGGNAPDICHVAIEGIQMFDKLGLALPIDDFIKKNPQLIGDALTDIHPRLQAPFVINGKTYGFVNDWNNVMMHFNTDRLKEAGLEVPKEDWNKDMFLEYCKKLTNGGKYAFAIPNYYFGTEGWLFAFGASMLNDDMTKAALNQPNAVEMFQLWQDLIHKYKYAPIPEPNTNAIQQLVDGQVAMGSWGRWPVRNYVDNKFKSVAIQFLPKFKETRDVVFGSGAICVLKSTKHPDEAMRTAVWTADRYFVEHYYGITSIPTRKSVADKVIPETGFPQNYDLYYKTADFARPVQSPPQYPAIASVFDRYLGAVLANEMPAKEAMDKAAAEIDAILAKK
jgi:multiple sugar transport system substrate-binding protein